MSAGSGNKRALWCVASLAACMALLALWALLRSQAPLAAAVASANAAMAQDGGAIATAIVAMAGAGAGMARRPRVEWSASAHAPVAQRREEGADSPEDARPPACIVDAPPEVHFVRSPEARPLRAVADDSPRSPGRSVARPRAPPAG